MAAVRHDPYPDFRQPTPQRQLLTVSELEQLFGPDATVELRSTRPERVEADLEVVPPRRTSRWMAPVLLVVFGAASLLGYALLRNTAAPVETATSLGSWVSKSTLGPTEETPIEVDYQLPPLVARISDSARARKPETPPTVEPPSAAPAPAVIPSVEPPSPVEAAAPAPPKAEPKRASQPKPTAARSARAKPARRAPVVAAPAAGREADDRATQQLIERDVERLGTESVPAVEPDTGATYPPGYIEAEIK